MVLFPVLNHLFAGILAFVLSFFVACVIFIRGFLFDAVLIFLSFFFVLVLIINLFFAVVLPVLARRTCTVILIGCFILVFYLFVIRPIFFPYIYIPSIRFFAVVFLLYFPFLILVAAVAAVFLSIFIPVILFLPLLPSLSLILPLSLLFFFHPFP